MVTVVLLVGGYAMAHGPGERHQVDPNSPSDVMMEQCTTMGMGPEGHTIAGRMIDQMHGEGAHHRMHQFMDQAMTMMGGMGAGGGMTDQQGDI
jgi:hypothetical protein